MDLSLTGEITGVSALSGTWICSLNRGILDADDVILTMDGPAGREWRIGQAFSDGSDHNQLYGWWYISALIDSTGLQGVRHRLRLLNGWCDVSVDATRRELTGSYKTGTSVIRSLVGCNLSETLTSTIGITHHSGFFFNGENGKRDYHQGSGSKVSDATILVQFDTSADLRAGVIPPIDGAYAGGTFTSNTSVNYAPMGKGSLLRNSGATGERDEIGLMNDWSARHFCSQTAINERSVRVNGLITSHMRTTLRRFSTKQGVPLNNNTYTGLGSTEASWQHSPGGSTGFVNPTNYTGSNCLWTSEFEPSHKAMVATYAYLYTGEREYLDLLQEGAYAMLAYVVPGTNTLTTTPGNGSFFTNVPSASRRNMIVNGTTYYCVVTLLGSALIREAAWMWRDVLHAWAFTPDSDPDGTDMKGFFNDCIDAGLDCLNAYNNLMPASWRASGITGFRPPESANGGWVISYFSNVAAHCYWLRRGTNAEEFRNHVGRWWVKLHEDGDIAAAACYAAQHRFENASVMVDSYDMLFELSRGLMSWNSVTDTFTIGPGGTGDNFDFTPQVNDRIAFNSYFSANKPFSSTPDGRIYHMVNVSGQTFQLALTSGGSPEDVVTSLTVGRVMARCADISPRWSFQGANDRTEILANTLGAMRYMEYTGHPSISAARAAHQANWAAGGGNYVGGPKYAFAASAP